MNRVSALTTFIPKTCVRRLSMTQVKSNKFDLSRIKKRQMQLQEDNGLPVYIKGGPLDYVMYYSTVVLVLVGLSASAHSLYNRIWKGLRLATNNSIRSYGTSEPCPPKQPEPPSKPREPCPPKVEPCPPPPKSTCPNPPPCSPMPHCPPTICPPPFDSGNPCNYCPPPCPDPESYNMTRMKKLQCFFQEENDIPIFLKRGNADAFLYQGILLTLIISIVMSFYDVYLMATK